jgi:hypothetical protein
MALLKRCWAVLQSETSIGSGPLSISASWRTRFQSGVVASAKGRTPDYSMARITRSRHAIIPARRTFAGETKSSKKECAHLVYEVWRMNTNGLVSHLVRALNTQ